MAITLSGDSPNLTSASLTTPTLTSPTFAGTPSGSIITSGTAVASTSGTSIDFTSIPSWVKRITVMLDVVSTNGSSLVQVQLGTSGGIQTTGYGSGGWQANITISSSTTGLLVVGSGGASNAITGHLVLTLMDSSTGKWVASGVAALVPPAGSGNAEVFAGGKTLSGTLDRIRITTVNGTDTFDAGSINILYE